MNKQKKKMSLKTKRRLKKVASTICIVTPLGVGTGFAITWLSGNGLALGNTITAEEVGIVATVFFFIGLFYFLLWPITKLFSWFKTRKLKRQKLELEIRKLEQETSEYPKQQIDTVDEI